MISNSVCQLDISRLACKWLRFKIFTWNINSRELKYPRVRQSIMTSDPQAIKFHEHPSVRRKVIKCEVDTSTPLPKLARARTHTHCDVMSLFPYKVKKLC